MDSDSDHTKMPSIKTEGGSNVEKVNLSGVKKTRKSSRVIDAMKKKLIAMKGDKRSLEKIEQNICETADGIKSFEVCRENIQETDTGQFTLDILEKCTQETKQVETSVKSEWTVKTDEVGNLNESEMVGETLGNPEVKMVSNGEEINVQKSPLPLLNEDTMEITQPHTDTTVCLDDIQIEVDGNSTGELVCYHCKGNFENQVDFDKHTCQGKTYICGACRSGFTRLYHLKRHKCKSITEAGKSEVGDISKLDDHSSPAVRSEDDENNENELQDDGNMDVENLILTETSQQQDNIKQRSNSKTFQCPKCPKKYAKEHFLTKHMFVHSDEKPWQCSECDAKFISATKYRNHCKTHGITNPFQCEKCNNFFSSVEVLRVHDRIHTDTRPYSCNKCGKTFKQCSNLHDHLRKHNNDRAFICGTCGKSFNLKGDLTKHLKLHTGQKPHQCPYCSMSFPRVSNLNRHVKTHEGTKPFSCSQCEKSFSRREKLREHERTHTGEKPYVCEICNRSFADSGNFSHHKRMHLEPGFKHPPRKKPTSVSNRNRTVKSSDSQFPVINVENRHAFSVSVDRTNQMPRPTVAIAPNQSHQQQQMIFVTLQNQILLPNREEPDSSLLKNANTGFESLLAQLQNISQSHFTPEKGPDLTQPPTNIATTNSGPNETLTDSPVVNLSTGPEAGSQQTIDPSPGMKILEEIPFVISDPRATCSSNPEETDNVESDSNKIKLLIQGDCPPANSQTAFVLSSTGYGKGPSNDKESDENYKMTNSFPSLAQSGSDTFFTSSLTLTDLTAHDDFANQPGFVLVPQDGHELDTSTICEILLATPTKANKDSADAGSRLAMISSQVLVTPEHHTVARNGEESRELSDDQRSQFRPRALKL